MNISYTKKGDYLLPNLILKDKEQFNIGKYGLLRLEYIKKEKLGLYFDLLVNGTLNEYLHDIDTILKLYFILNIFFIDGINLSMSHLTLNISIAELIWLYRGALESTFL